MTSGYATSLRPFYSTPRRRTDVLWHCNDVVCPLSRRYFLKKVVPSFEKRSARYLTVLAKPLKMLMKEFSLEFNFTKNKLRHRYEHSHKKRLNSLETGAVFIEISMLSCNLTNGPKYGGLLLKKYGSLWRESAICRWFSCSSRVV